MTLRRRRVGKLRPLPPQESAKHRDEDYVNERSEEYLIKGRTIYNSYQSDKYNDSYFQRKQRTKHYYVGNITGDSNSADMAKYIEERGVKVLFLNLMSCISGGQGAKLEVPLNFSDTVEKENFWPHGIYIRRWHPQKPNGRRETK